MQLMERKLIRVMFIILTIIIILVIGYFVTGQNPMEKSEKETKENFQPSATNYQIIDISYSIPPRGIPQGFYSVGNSRMAQLPYNNYASLMPPSNTPLNGYFVLDIPSIGRRMAQIPSGFILDQTDPNNTTIQPVTKTAIYDLSADIISGTENKAKQFYSSNVNAPTYTTPEDLALKSQYKSNDVNIQYHDNISDINSQAGIYDISFSNIYVYDNNGNRIILPHFLSQSSPTYYTPGSFIFGSSGYVPNYEDSVYLSKTTGLSTLKTVQPESSIKGGFCSQFATSQLQMEQKCNSIDNATCASTDCCVLFGGSKCVSGNDKGPYMKSVFTDPTIAKKDVYYFKGNCYGNCN
jgi:hypothetical protein